ncbi:MAG: choice-of-anchor J domain-containing protein [bacterium]
MLEIGYIGITNVSFSTINNTPPVLPVPGNYGDFSAMSGNVEQGATIPVMITFETGVPFRTKIWIDWNDDFDFREPGETVYSGTSAGASPTTLAASFIVPPAVSLGNHRMRIGSVDGFWGAIATPCCAGVWGSYQDYTVNVIPQTILSGTVTGTAGEPITGATVSFGTHTTTSQANGSYIFNNLLAGTYTVSCSKTGYQTSIATGVVIAANAINIHDFILNHLLYPPVNLQGVVQNQYDAHLTWMAPVADQWIKWDNGIAYTVIGTGSVSNFDVASRWPASDIAPYAGKYLKKIRIFPNSASCTYTIKVWKGANAATLLYSQVVVAPAIGAFNEITLATPVLIDGTDEFWFGYNVNSTGGYPAGCDAGPQVAGMGNMIYWGGAWKELTALNAALTYNWNIAGYVSLDPVQGNQPLLPMAQVTPLASMKIADTPGAGTFDDSTLQPGQLVNAIFPSACKLNEVSPGDDSHVSGGNTGGEGDTPLFALMGYNVYRNSIKINGSSLVSGVQYNDPGLSSGTYDYAVTAVYDEGESAPSLPATITICNYTPITGTTPATRCGIGTAVLGATCTGGIIKWYTAATGGTAVGNGPSFTTPVISSTTSYYVSTLAEGNYGNVGPSYIAYGNFSQAGAAGIMISTTLPGITINSADIPFSGTGTMTIALKDVTNTTVISSVTTGTITGAGNTSAVTVPLGLQIAMPGNYLLILNSATGTIGNLGWSIGTYPYTAMSGAFGITGGYWYGTSTWLMALYNLSVSMCESSRTQVTATVTPPPALAVTAGLTICNNTAVALSVTSIIPDYDTYTWSPAAGLFEDAACQVPYVTGANFETLYFRSPVAGLHTYTCTANNLTTMCANIAATTVTNLPANPVVTATRASICTGGTSVLTTIPATGYGTATFQWQGSTDNNTFADITAATSIGYTTPVLTGTSFYKLLIKTGGNTCTESNVATVTVNDPQVLSVTPATRCGIGSVTLGATASTGSNLHWYTAATGGFPVGAGSLYTTPPVSSTTSYYVNATGGSGSENVGPSYSGEWNYWQGGSYGIMITTTLPNIVINSADIPFTGTGKLTIALKNEANTTVISSVTTGTITGAGTTSVTVPLGLQVAAPGNYLLIVNSFTGTIGALGFSLCTYPFTALSGAFSITNGYNVEPSPYYNMFFYNLVVTGECGSPRTQVTATVTPPPALAVTPDPTTCNNTATALSVTSAIPDYDTYTWSPEAGLFEDAACQTPYVPGSNFTTVYFKSAVAGPHAFTCSAGNLATGCANIATTMVTNLPANPFVSANPAALCSSGISELTTVPASGYGTATFQWQSSSDNIAFTDVIAATSIGYTTPLLTGTTYYKLLVKTGGNVCTESYVATVNVYNAHVLTITPATRCGTGIVNLEATAGPGENLHWYTAAAGGPPVGYGSPFSTPPISLTTTFYVCASLGETSGHAGPVYIYNANDWSSTVGSPGIMITTTLPDIVINSVDIPFAGTGTLTIALKDLTNTSVISSVTTGTVTGAGTTSVTVPLGLHVVTPGSYLLIVNSVSGTINMLGYSYCTYPFTALSGAFNITSGYWWGACSINAYLYNLAVSYACESPRTPVTATVLPAPMPMAAFASLNRVCDAATPFNLSSSPTCISPTQEGGFEQGNTFALNNWTAANGTSNTWTVGTAAGVQEGSHAAYAGTNFVGTGNAGVNHFYRDITIPPGATNITLKFYLKMPVIDDGYDFFEVYTAQTTYTPVVNTNPYDNNVHHLLWFTNTSTAYNTYTLLTVPLSDTLAGTTRRYIFTYRCDAEAPYAVPAVDNISVTADFPEPPTYLWTSAPAGFVSTLQNPTGITQGATTRYTVTAQNSYGCAVTAGTTVFSFSGASVITQPAAATTCAGQTAVFTVVTEDPGLSYQWRKNLVDISVAGNASASTATLSLPNVTQADAAVYDVVVTAACGSSLTSSSAALTVKPTPMASATSNSPVCEGGQISLAGSSDIGISYNWTGPNGFTSSGQFPTISAAPLAAGGTYLCTASLNGCSSAAATVGVTVKPMPGAVTITPAAPVLACGAIQEMTATGGTVNSTLLNENFNGQVPGWTAANNSSGGTPANAAWNFIPEGYYTNIHSNDNSGYVMSNSDAQGNGSTTSTQLMTPVMNTVGYTSLTLSFWHNFEVYTPADVAKIEVSTDGGTTWGSSALAAYTANEGTSTSWVHKILDLSAYVNQPALQIRFNYYAVYGYYWAIDNVSITGLQSATYTWSPLTDLYADAGAASAYTGTQTPVVWAKPSASATYTVTATSPAGCPNTAGVLVTVSPASLPVSVTVSPSSNPVCAGTEVTYTATPANGGTVPEYQWQKGGITISGATNATYSYIPGNNDAITCSVTSNAACVIGNPATSGVVTMTVSPLIAANFGANKLTPQKNEIVQFTDMTAGSPTSWDWSFDRPTFAFVYGTSASSQNPQVIFTDGGPYTVTLLVSNSACSGSEIKPAFLRAGIPGLWTGNSSGAWNTATNWEDWLVPGSSTDVVIPASAVTNWPVFTGDLIIGIHCGSLTLDGTDSKLTVTGNLTIQ